MIVKPKITNEEFLNQTVISSKKKTMYNVKFGPIQKPIFKLNNCVTKYPLGKYDKMTVEHEENEFMDNLNLIIKKSLGKESDKFVDLKKGEINIKIPEVMKSKAKEIQKFDVVDVLIEFNNCWLMGDKIYMSFVLKDIKESEEIMPRKESPFLFTDIEE